MFWLNNLKASTAMNAKISVFLICIEAIVFLLSYNLHDCTFKALGKFKSCPQNIMTCNGEVPSTVPTENKFLCTFDKTEFACVEISQGEVGNKLVSDYLIKIKALKRRWG